MIQFFILCKHLASRVQKGEDASAIIKQIVDAVNAFKLEEIEEVENVNN